MDALGREWSYRLQVYQEPIQSPLGKHDRSFWDSELLGQQPKRLEVHAPALKPLRSKQEVHPFGLRVAPNALIEGDGGVGGAEKIDRR